MNIQAIWENGVFRPIQPISVKHTKLTIVVPDEEIVSDPVQESTDGNPIRQRIDEILGPYKQALKQQSSMSAQDYKKIWQEHLEEKYLGRR